MSASLVGYNVSTVQVLVVDEKLFTLEQIDQNLTGLNLHPRDGDKPSPLTGISLATNDSNLRQHGMYILPCFIPMTLSTGGSLVLVGITLLLEQLQYYLLL